MLQLLFQQSDVGPNTEESVDRILWVSVGFWSGSQRRVETVVERIFPVKLIVTNLHTLVDICQELRFPLHRFTFNGVVDFGIVPFVLDFRRWDFWRRLIRLNSHLIFANTSYSENYIIMWVFPVLMWVRPYQKYHKYTFSFNGIMVMIIPIRNARTIILSLLTFQN